MPPKKGKKKKKSGKKGKKSGKSSGKTVASEIEQVPKLSADNKGNFLIQVKDLEKQIEFYQKRCDQLEIENVLFEGEFTQLNNDKEDISDYLEKMLEIQVGEITQLNYELTQLQELRDQEKKAYENQITEKETEFKEIEEQLTSDDRMKRAQLASMDQLKEQKENLMEKFDKLHDEIRMLDEFNKEEIYQKERAAVVDLDGLKKEMSTKVNNVASEFRKVSNRQMSETNKKTIRENVDLSDLLQKKSEKTIVLLEENDRLRHTIDKEQKLEIEISETVETELQKKNNRNMKEVRYWVEECRNSEAEIAQFESESHRSEAERIQSQNKLLIAQNESQINEQMSMITENKFLLQEKEELIGRLAASKENLRIHKRLVNRTKDSLIDAENLLDPSGEFTESEVIITRQRMMNSLLQLLNSAASLGFGIEPAELGKQKRVSKF